MIIRVSIRAARRRAAVVLLPVVLVALDATAQTRITPVQPIGAESTRDNSASASLNAGAGLTLQRDIEIHLGPFLLRPGIGAGTGLQSGLSASDDGGTRTSARFFLDAGPTLDILLPLGARHLFSGTGQARYRFSPGDSSAATRNGWLYSGTAGYQFTGTVLRAAATYTTTKTQEGLLAFIEDGAAVDVTDTVERVDLRREAVGGRIEFVLSPRTRLRFQGDETRSRYEDAPDDEFDFAELDRNVKSFGVALDRQLTSLTNLSLFADLRRSTYIAEDSFRNNDQIRGGATMAFSGGASPLSGSLSAGAEYRDASQQALEDFTGLFALGTVRARVSPRVGVSAGANVRTTPTAWEGNVYAINSGFVGGVDVFIFRNLNLGGSIGYTRVRYPEPATFLQDDGTLLTDKRADERLTYRVTLGFRIFGVQLSVQGGYFNRTSNFNVGDSSGYFFRLGGGFNVQRSL